MDPSAITICLTAFSAVFVLLIIFALVINIITFVFPGKSASDTAVIAAINATVSQMIPGARVTEIKEQS